MALLIRRMGNLRVRKKEPSPLEQVGLLDSYRHHAAIRPMTWPHHEPGDRVEITAKSGAWRFICRCGDTGTVQKVFQASPPQFKNPEDDLYFVKLDKPRISGKEVAYLTYKELTRCVG